MMFRLQLSKWIAGLDTQLSFNSNLHVQHLDTMGKWAKDGKIFYAGRRNEGGANFRGGECMFLLKVQLVCWYKKRSSI